LLRELRLEQKSNAHYDVSSKHLSVRFDKNGGETRSFHRLFLMCRISLWYRWT